MQTKAASFQPLRKSIGCVCGDEHRFADLEKIICQYWVEPYSCTGGAYWRDGEWNYICPTLNRRIRILFLGSDKSGVDYRQAKELEKAFKRLYSNGWKSEIREERYEERYAGNFSNNHVVEDDPIGYGLMREVFVTERRFEIR